jgi:hypothetical protein
MSVTPSCSAAGHCRTVGKVWEQGAGLVANTCSDVSDIVHLKVAGMRGTLRIHSTTRVNQVQSLNEMQPFTRFCCWVTSTSLLI